MINSLQLINRLVTKELYGSFCVITKCSLMLFSTELQLSSPEDLVNRSLVNITTCETVNLVAMLTNSSDLNSVLLEPSSMVIQTGPLINDSASFFKSLVYTVLDPITSNLTVMVNYTGPFRDHLIIPPVPSTSYVTVNLENILVIKCEFANVTP